MLFRFFLFKLVSNKKVMKKYLILSLFLVVFSLNASDTLVIGTKISEPFVYKHGDEYNGLSFDVIKDYLDELGKPYIVKELKTLTYDQVIDSINVSGVDVFVGDITVTYDRLNNAKFSQPYFVTNTSIVTKKINNSAISNLFTYKFMESMGMLIVFILLSGLIMWLVERNHNDGFSKGILGIFDGSYFVSATMTTVGYGDVAAKTKLGKVLSFILMWLSLGIVGLMYGNITTALTVAQLETEINISDLNKMKVGTVNGTTSSKFLVNNDVKYVNFNTPEEALDAINNNELDAFVFDKPILEYYLGMDKYSDIMMVNKDYMEQTYGFVLPLNSGLIDDLNVSILKTIRGREWDVIKNKYNIK